MFKCRICDKQLERPFLSLGNAPLSNAFLTKDDLNQMEPYYPLDVYFCGCCQFVQIQDFKPAKEIFSSQYPYFSSLFEIF